MEMGRDFPNRRLVSAGATLLALLLMVGGQAWTAPGVAAAADAAGSDAARAVAGGLNAAGSGRVLAIGDIHGDFEALTGILREIGLIDEDNSWIGGEATLVQTGDFTDRGPDVRRVMDLLMRLQAEAAAEGGRVEVLLANHEGMNLVDFWRDNSPADYEAFVDERSEKRQGEAYDEYVELARHRADVLSEKEPDFTSEVRGRWLNDHPLGFVERMEAFGPDGVYGKWLRERPTAVRIDDTIFIHGGINQQLAEWSLEEINERVRQEIKDFDSTKRAMVDRKLIVSFATLQEMVDAADSELGRFQTKQRSGRRLDARESETAKILERFLTINSWLLLHPEGPLWFRGYAKWPDTGGQMLIDEVLDKLGAKHIVVGHTPQQGGILPRFGGKIFLIDTGMLSSHYAGRASALEILDGKFTALYGEERALLLDTSAGAPRSGGIARSLGWSTPRLWMTMVSGEYRNEYRSGSGASVIHAAAVSPAPSALERRWYGPAGEDTPLRTDDQVLDFLATAEVVDSGGVGQGVAQARWVILERDGVQMRAIFHDIDQRMDRVRVGGNFYLRFTDSWKAQCAAYELSRLMGLSNVPPTVQRRIGRNTGSLQAWVEDGITDMKRREKQAKPPDYRRYIQDNRILQVWDNLIYNIDRHAGNILFDPEWNMWFIDHTRAFEFKRELLDEGQIAQVERVFWDRLNNVGDDAIREVLSPYIGGSDISALLERRRMIVDRLNQLIAERGTDAVVFDLDTHDRFDETAASPQAGARSAEAEDLAPGSLLAAA